MNFNQATQVLGMLCFTGAAIVCAIAWLRIRRGGVWGVLALLHAGLSLEVLLQFRHVVSLRMRGVLRQTSLYHERADLQVTLVALFLLCVLAVAFWLILSRLRTAGGASRSAVAASLCALSLFGLEMISLHGVEAALYGSAGPFFMIGWAWGALALTVSLAAFQAARRR